MIVFISITFIITTVVATIISLGIPLGEWEEEELTLFK